MLTAASLFTGGGLFDAGAGAAGYRHLWGVELVPAIAAVAERNGYHTLVADVRTLAYASLPRPDHLHASPPCISASIANRDRGETALDRELAAAVCRAVVDLEPATFSLENVTGYHTYDSFALIRHTLHRLGYVTSVAVVNAADYGVPQTRRRLILRAARGHRMPVLQPTHRNGGDLLHAPWQSWYAAIQDLIPDLAVSPPARWQQRHLARAVLPPGGVLMDGTNSSNGGGGLTLRRATQPAFALCSSRVAAHRMYADGQWRRLNLACLVRLQTVPDGYHGLTPRIIGNGVPCLLAQRIMESLWPVHEVTR